jgi:hypothetical protein
MIGGYEVSTLGGFDGSMIGGIGGYEVFTLGGFDGSIIVHSPSPIIG